MKPIAKETGGITVFQTWEVIDDVTCEVLDRITVNLDNANGYETASALARQHGQSNYMYRWDELMARRRGITPKL